MESISLPIALIWSLGLVVLIVILFFITKSILLVKAIRHENSRLQSLNINLNSELAVANEKSYQIEFLTQQLNLATEKSESIQETLSQESKARARAEQQASRIPEFEAECLKLSSTNGTLQSELTQLKTLNAELQTRIEAEHKNAEEKLQLVKTAEDQLVHQFKSLAGKILEEKSKTFTEQNKTNISNILSPLQAQLGEFKKKVEDVYVNESKDRASLKEAIKNLHLENQRMTQEANNLVKALKGDKKIQGNWGELILEKVLEQSGLRKDFEYHTQGGFRDSDNRLLKPDVVVHLPENKDVIIDSKVSLIAYETYSSAESDLVRRQSLDEHVVAIRNHIKTLSSKDYSNVKGLRSLDFVLMFMPIEAAFLAAFQHDDNLFSDAFKNNIIVVTPTTLLATLRTIENIWRYERQNESSRIIADKAGSLYDKIRGFVEDFEKLGSQVSTVQNTYDTIMNKLTRGKGNLIRQTESFVELGIKIKKPIPKSIVELADNDTLDAHENRVQETQEKT